MEKMIRHTALVIFGILISLAFASSLSSTVCCEKTNSGLYCQNVPAEECAAGSKQVPTSCESTSFCKAGTCFNSGQGTCSDNTPQLVCENNNGKWSEQFPAQCETGCCILGDQAAFVTLTRCKYLSAKLGLKTNYNKQVKSEDLCVLSVQNQEKGACVYEFEFQKTCRFTTRENCNSGVNITKGEFFEGKLCSAPELGTNCAKTKKTICSAGKDEVYFVDTCGNIANIYDASKIDNEEYWSNIKTKAQSCNSNSANSASKSCGNCNYLLGSYCRASKEEKATYGDNICSDLNCKLTSNGKSYKHGESWCVYNDKGETGKGNNAVGSRFYKHICINGKEVVEQCADFRQEECIEDKIKASNGEFSQAACRVNRWQDCSAQTEKENCENTDRRDCSWRNVKVGGVNGVCVPLNNPGIKFWEGDEAKAICEKASSSCVVTFEKTLLGGEKCKTNCECLKPDWKKDMAGICVAIGDCGPKINWQGDKGYKQ
ncbi:MAG: hypothetical protein AABW65_01765 [Nanoarchaeota archaeon]